VRPRTSGGPGLRRALLAASVALAALCPGCATDGGTYVEGGVYGGFYYDDPWYWGGCCVDPPDDIGPPRPEHPIAKPPPARPSHPIATPRPMPAPRPAAMPRGGGGRR